LRPLLLDLASVHDMARGHARRHVPMSITVHTVNRCRNN
jgi:hypothetical protein